MARRLLLNLATLVAIALVAASIASAAPTGEPAPPPVPGESLSRWDLPATIPDNWQMGFAFWDRSAPFGSREGLRSLRHLRAVGADTVSPVITWYVAHPWDPHLRRGKGTPSDQDLVAAIERAHHLGLRVVLRFHVDCEDGSWRANINPDDKDRWFAAYGAALNHYAELAETHHVEGMVIGAELVSLTRPEHTAWWQSIIGQVRSRFGGFLTYSAQWGSAPPTSLTDPYREFEQIGFWPELDYLGVSAYFELASGDHPAPSHQQLVARWQEWRTLQVEPFQARHGKPLLFTEVGYRSANGSAWHPWDHGVSQEVNLRLQADLFDALFESWASVPWFHGAYFWFWPTDADGTGRADADYPPAGKPAQEVIRRWFRALHDMERVSLRWGGAGGTIPVEARREGGE